MVAVWLVTTIWSQDPLLSTILRLVIFNLLGLKGLKKKIRYFRFLFTLLFDDIWSWVYGVFQACVWMFFKKSMNQRPYGYGSREER